MPDSPSSPDPRETALKRLVAGGTISGLGANARAVKRPRRRLIVVLVGVLAVILADALGLTPEPVQAALQMLADELCVSFGDACD
jgi:hypothetical protein